MHDAGTTVWPEVDRLLDEALSMPAVDRAAWLASLPPQHAGLRTTLLRLPDVQAHIETGDFLATLPKLGGLAADRPAPADSPGRTGTTARLAANGGGRAARAQAEAILSRRPVLGPEHRRSASLEMRR